MLLRTFTFWWWKFINFSNWSNILKSFNQSSNWIDIFLGTRWFNNGWTLQLNAFNLLLLFYKLNLVFLFNLLLQFELKLYLLIERQFSFVLRLFVDLILRHKILDLSLWLSHISVIISFSLIRKLCSYILLTTSIFLTLFKLKYLLIKTRLDFLQSYMFILQLIHFNSLY